MKTTLTFQIFMQLLNSKWCLRRSSTNCSLILSLHAEQHSHDIQFVNRVKRIWNFWRVRFSSWISITLSPMIAINIKIAVLAWIARTKIISSCFDTKKKRNRVRFCGLNSCLTLLYTFHRWKTKQIFVECKWAHSSIIRCNGIKRLEKSIFLSSFSWDLIFSFRANAFNVLWMPILRYIVSTYVCC